MALIKQKLLPVESLVHEVLHALLLFIQNISPILTTNTDDQIWKNSVFNKEMTFKMQPATS